MPLRAFRLLPTSAEATFATSLSFSSTLQLAASRAWTRRVVAHSQPKHVGKRGVRTATQCQAASKPIEVDESTQPGPSILRNVRPANFSAGGLNNYDYAKPTDVKASHIQSARLHTNSKTTSANVIHFDPCLNDYEPSDAEISEDESYPHGQEFLDDIRPEDLPEIMKLASAHPLRPGLPSRLPTPKSRSSLYRNFLYLVNMCKPPPKLPALLDYHALYPEWQSTPSYNLLISLAIRHQAYGIVRRLLANQRDHNLPKNLETYKLEVRWLIHQGLWDDAWRYVQDLKDNRELPIDGSGRIDIPFPIWLEFCRSPRKRRIRTRSVYDDDGKLLERFFEKVPEEPKELQARQRLLNQSRPASMPPLASTSPFAIYCIVQLLARSGNRDRAFELTKAFFGTMPRTLNHRSIVKCLNIIHVHMVFSPAKNGLPRFFEARRTMVSLLKLHPSLRPNSRTLYLLLAPLQRAKRCGTIAWDVLRSFKSQWGANVEDRRVQRRVCQLALKEGRMDIVKKIVWKEASQRRYRQRRLLEEQMVHSLKPLPTRWHIRIPLRQIFHKNGKEARLWYRLRARIRLKIYRRKQRRLQIRYR